MKYKLGIIAPQLMKNHISYYEAIILLFAKHNYEITFFGDSWFEKNISASSSLSFESKQPKESTFTFFRSVRNKVKKCNIIIVEQSYGVTLSYIFGISRIRVKKLYTVHNVNSWLSPRFSFKPKAILTNWTHKYIVSNADGIIVISASLKEYIKKKNLIGKKPTFYLPFSYLDLEKTPPVKTKSDFISIVIPGTINPLRRDYGTVLMAFENVLISGVKNLKLVFLGKPIFESKETSEIVDRINKINNTYKNTVLFWHDFIPQSEFNHYLRQANFLLSNLKDSYPYSENYEIYGKTKETGIPDLMCQHQKPCIIIGDYKPANQLSKHTINVKNLEQLTSIFTALSTGKIETALYTSGYHQTLKEIQKEIDKEFKALLSFVNQP